MDIENMTWEGICLGFVIGIFSAFILSAIIFIPIGNESICEANLEEAIYLAEKCVDIGNECIDFLNETLIEKKTLLDIVTSEGLCYQGQEEMTCPKSDSQNSGGKNNG